MTSSAKSSLESSVCFHSPENQMYARWQIAFQSRQSSGYSGNIIYQPCDVVYGNWADVLPQESLAHGAWFIGGLPFIAGRQKHGAGRGRRASQMCACRLFQVVQTAGRPEAGKKDRHEGQVMAL
jgi:hypothetical protein